jgi:hypothetical protein
MTGWMAFNSSCSTQMHSRPSGQPAVRLPACLRLCAQLLGCEQGCQQASMLRCCCFSALLLIVLPNSACLSALPCRDMLRKVKDAPRLLARLQGGQTLPDPGDLRALQASLAASLMLRDVLVQLAPGGEASLLGGQGSMGGGGASGGGRGGGGGWGMQTPTAVGAAAAAAGGGGGGGGGSFAERMPTSSDPQEQQGEQQGGQQQQQGRQGGSCPAVPGIMFKAAAVIREELVLCEWGLPACCHCWLSWCHKINTSL